MLLYYKFITQFAGERDFTIGDHLANLRTKWLIVSYAPFALRFFPQRQLRLDLLFRKNLFRNNSVWRREWGVQARAYVDLDFIDKCRIGLHFAKPLSVDKGFSYTMAP